MNMAVIQSQKGRNKLYQYTVRGTPRRHEISRRSIARTWTHHSFSMNFPVGELFMTNDRMAAYIVCMYYVTISDYNTH